MLDGDKVPTCYIEIRKEVDDMRPKEIQKKLGINADRIKLFKREGVFTPENPPSGNRGTDYTESDFKNLQFLVVLTKMGLTCSDIRKMQEGDCTLEEAVNYRKNQIEADMEKKRNALTMITDQHQKQKPALKKPECHAPVLKVPQHQNAVNQGNACVVLQATDCKKLCNLVKKHQKQDQQEAF